MSENNCTTCRFFLPEVLDLETALGGCGKYAKASERFQIARSILKQNGYKARMTEQGVYRTIHYREGVDIWPLCYEPTHVTCTSMWEPK